MPNIDDANLYFQLSGSDSNQVRRKRILRLLGRTIIRSANMYEVGYLCSATDGGDYDIYSESRSFALVIYGSLSVIYCFMLSLWEFSRNHDFPLGGYVNAVCMSIMHMSIKALTGAFLSNEITKQGGVDLGADACSMLGFSCYVLPCPIIICIIHFISVCSRSHAPAPAPASVFTNTSLAWNLLELKKKGIAVGVKDQRHMEPVVANRVLPNM